MAETLHDFSAAVENLIAINRDAEQGFRAAADSVGDTVLKRMFVELSGQRAGFASEIQDAVRKIGFEPTNPLGASGTLHGVWIAFKGKMLANKEHAALEEAERGEDQSLRTYREAMALILQPELLTLLERQLAAIQESHARIRAFRNQTAPVPANKS
ncbi:MAG TPA: PA2169 family four-helix-bundle protein [Bryobacteraceae bacterium]|nr:PA2169 family four-helix-bundle protein [Bryobacteraceae bacterium]